MSINILLTQTHTGTVKPIDSLATLPQHSVPCLSSLQPYPCSPMKLALVSSFITTFSFLRLLSCFLSFVRSFWRPCCTLAHIHTHTHVHMYTILTHTGREREVEGDTCVLFACLRCVIIFFVGSTSASFTFFSIPLTVCLFRIFALLWIFSAFCLSEYGYIKSCI